MAPRADRRDCVTCVTDRVSRPRHHGPGVTAPASRPRRQTPPDVTAPGATPARGRRRTPFPAPGGSPTAPCRARAGRGGTTPRTPTPLRSGGSTTRRENGRRTPPPPPSGPSRPTGTGARPSACAGSPPTRRRRSPRRRRRRRASRPGARGSVYRPVRQRVEQFFLADAVLDGNHLDRPVRAAAHARRQPGVGARAGIDQQAHPRDATAPAEHAGGAQDLGVAVHQRSFDATPFLLELPRVEVMLRHDPFVVARHP